MKYVPSPLHLIPGAFLLASSGAQIQAEFLGPSTSSSFCYYVSHDGATIVGGRGDLSASPTWWDLTSGTVTNYSATPPSLLMRAFNANGDAVAGNGDAGVAILWESNGQATDLGSLYGNGAAPLRVSHDGSTVVGFSPTANSIQRSFRWTAATGMQNLGILNGPGRSIGAAVSADGQVVAGSAVEAGVEKAFRWTSATGMTALPLPSPSLATEVSADGEIFFAITRLPTDPSARRTPVLWSSSAGMTALGPNNNSELVRSAMSDDGSVVAWQFASENTTYYWNASGSVPLTIIDSWSLMDISSDGSTLILRRGIGSTFFGARWSSLTGTIETLETPMDARRVEPRSISGDGSLIAGMVLPEGSSAFIAAIWRTDGNLGIRYCGPTIPNSTGEPTELRATGTNLISANDLTLRATSLPNGTFGYFLGSQTQANVFPVNQSEGRLCLGGAIGRFIGPQQIMNSGTSGAFEMQLPLDALATPSGLVAATPGETWNLQAWFRDSNPASTSNFTNGLQVWLQ